jgi:hypothetical protein
MVEPSFRGARYMTTAVLSFRPVAVITPDGMITAAE